MTEKPEIIIFLTRDKITFLVPTRNIIKVLNLPQTAIKDLEVIDPNLLGNMVREFVEKEKIGSAGSLIIISDSISFTHDIQAGEESKKGVLVQDFTDTVPLDLPEVKMFKELKEGGVNKIVAVNPKFYEVLVESLKAKGFTILGVIPASIIPETQKANEITLDIANKLLTDFDKLKLQSFVNTALETESTIRPQIITTQKPKGARIYILVAVFVLMGIIFLALLFLRK